MKVQLRIKQLPNGSVATSGYTPKAEHLPDVAKKANRTHIKPGEIMEVDGKDVAREYTSAGFLEVVI
jgi:hypothetical protein